MNYNENLVENKVTIEDLNELFSQLSDTPYWIPKFPTEFRAHSGVIISWITAFYVAVMLFLGGTHQVLGVGAFLAAIGALILALIAGRVGAALLETKLEANYLSQREREFVTICEAWNVKMSSKGVKIEVGRYGSYLVLEFKKCLVGLGKFLMKAKKIKANIDKRKQEERLKNDGKTPEEDKY